MFTKWHRNKVPIILLISMLLVSGCRPYKGGITIAGSTSVQPFAELLAEEYMNNYPQIIINVQGGGSGAGIMATMSGTADIGMSSRELTGDEEELWSVAIAIDGLALIVHPSNPVKSLSLAQAQGIYSGTIRNWSEVGGLRANIHLVAREEGSGTRDAFQKLVMGDADIAGTSIVQDSNGAVREVVASDSAAIGFMSLGLINERVKALEIDGIAATRENIVNSSYHLFRRFLFLTREAPSGDVKSFIDFTLSEEGQKILSREGLITSNGVTGD